MAATWYGDDSPHLSWKCAQVTGKAGENGQHSGEMVGSSALDLGWRSSSKTAPGSLSTGSRAGRTPPHGDGSMYSQAYVRAGKVLRHPIRALPSVIVDTEKALREADGPEESDSTKKSASGGKVIAPVCVS